MSRSRFPFGENPYQPNEDRYFEGIDRDDSRWVDAAKAWMRDPAFALYCDAQPDPLAMIAIIRCQQAQRGVKPEESV